jgi:hypothetical protein
MPTNTRDIFTTLTTEGALLPPDILQRIADGDESLEGLSPQAYHQYGRLNEATNFVWNRLQGFWQAFQTARAKLPEGDAGTSLTRERWLLPLFDLLGYGRLDYISSIEHEGQRFSISHQWRRVPINLIGCNSKLDERSKQGSPHSQVQVLLNRDDSFLWGFLSNGLRLRILRDNISLTRQAYIEFDLESMMEGEVYSDFVLLYLLCHQSRVEAENPADYWLEQWRKTAEAQGKRALDELRDGVERAITHLGTGFLEHPENIALRDALQTGALDKQDYYRQLLRLVYRLLFLFVAEDRNLLHLPSANDAQRKLYHFYSSQRLREVAANLRGTRHHDLYESLRIVMQLLGGVRSGAEGLGLPVLGSFLFEDAAMPDIIAAKIANRDLLEAIRAISSIEDSTIHRLRRVDFKNLGSEELGSVYESLLELHPEIENRRFRLDSAGGNERKTTGSYYTPTSLINALLDSALDPVLDEAAKKGASAILALKICDPACGSGHFLIAAAHRIAKRLAQVQTGEDEPTPAAINAAKREVIAHCIYGVDINPMAVELCKVNLWLESIDPGKPLSFLDHRIQVGNSLLGTTPALMANGIPDEAFSPIEGDDKAFVSTMKKLNKKEREQRKGQFGNRQLGLFDEAPSTDYRALSRAMHELDAIPDSTLEGIRRKAAYYAALANDPDYNKARLLADAWCAAFVWEKRPDVSEPLTDLLYRRMERDPLATNLASTRAAIIELAQQYQFFHWHIAFPDVFTVDMTVENEQTGWSGGFDCILGNPPWDTLSPDLKEFFSFYDAEIRNQDRDGQDAIVAGLLENSVIAERWQLYCRELYSFANYFRNSNRYVFFAPGNLGKGDFNVYRIFIEAAYQITKLGANFAQLVPEGLYSGANAMAIRKSLFEQNELKLIFGFENSGGTWFRDAHRSLKFCLYSATKGGRTSSFEAAFNIRTESEFQGILTQNRFNLPVSLVIEFSPDALAIMEFSNADEISIAQKMYKAFPKFGEEIYGYPYRQYMTEIHMGNDRGVFGDYQEGYPLYEGRMVAHYDHTAKGYRSGRGRKAVWEDLAFGDPKKSIQPQWRVPVNKIPAKTKSRILDYRIGFCDVTSPTNERSLVSTIIPAHTICGHKIPTISFSNEFDWYLPIWVAVANSYAMDYLARKKVSLSMSYTILDSLPFPRLSLDHPLVAKLIPLVLQLVVTDTEMMPYWNQIAKYGFVNSISENDSIPGLIDDISRLKTTCQIEYIVSNEMFGLAKSEIARIMDSFPIIKWREEEKYGSFISKELILEMYDSNR